MPEPRQVRSMFASIAGRYDLLNRVLSAGIDQRWRRAAVSVAERATGGVRGCTVVDVCCGTGDLSLAFADAGAHVLGVDFTPEMLAVARHKRPGAEGEPLFAQGDAMRLPFPDARADVASVAFGIRNVEDRARGLAELARVVRPGGLVLVLEFTTPPGAVLGRLYKLYFTQLLPRIGRIVSGDDSAYSYLPRTVMAWPSPGVFQDEFEAAGLVDCGHRRLTRGIACLHWGRVPA